MKTKNSNFKLTSWGKVFLYSSLFLFSVFIFLLSFMYYLSKELPSINELKSFNPDQISKIISSDGKLIHKFQAVKKREVIKIGDVPQALEACHIYPYMGPKTNHPQNGIILRSDLHSLYDQNLIYIDKNYIIRLSDRLKISSQYSFLEGQKIKNLPKDKDKRPSKDSIGYKLKEAKFD